MRVDVAAESGQFVVTDPSREFADAVKDNWTGGRWRSGRYLVPATWQCLVRLSEIDGGCEWTRAASDQADRLHAAAVRAAHLAGDRSADGEGRPEWLSQPQRAGAAWLAESGAALLCDEMGSGKTVMACAALDAIAHQSALVVCPKAVVSVWEDHLARVAGYRVFAVDGPVKQRREALAEFERHDGRKAVVTTWPLLPKLARLEHWPGVERSDAEKDDKEFDALEFGVAVFDEAHRAKDPKAKQTRAAWSVRAEQRWALTGTPVANKPDDLWSVLRLVDAESWGSRAAFTSEFCDLGWGPWGQVEVLGWREDRMDRLGRLAAPVYRRRSMEECVGRRIDRVRETRLAHLTAAHRRQYQQVEDEWRVVADGESSWSANALAATVRLCQAAAAPLDVEDGGVAMTGPSPKVAALRDLLGDLPPDEPVVVFTASRQLAEIAAPVLDRHKHPAEMLVGGMSRGEIDAAVARWEAGESQVLLATYGTGSEGLTLTRAKVVVHLHSGWSSVARMQAEDRVRRWTQEAPAVLVVDIVSAGTIDERVQRVLAEKRDLLDAVSPVELAASA